jgi:hypothetical protein
MSQFVQLHRFKQLVAERASKTIAKKPHKGYTFNVPLEKQIKLHYFWNFFVPKN